MPTSKTRGLRIPSNLEQLIAEEAETLGKSWSAVTNELLEEALRMRRAPGVIFVAGPAGRRAVVAGTGLDVWELIATWRSCEEDPDRLRANYDWLTEAQLRAALSYYELYPDEIDARLLREQSWTQERVRRELPFSRPRTDTRRRP